jgi:RNA polymerase sigma-70 factor (ECF subfamily)
MPVDDDPSLAGSACPPPLGIEAEVASLHDRYSAELLAYAACMAKSRDAARDALQEVFLRYFVERSYGRVVAYPRAWLYRVLRNYLLDLLDTAALKREVGPELGADVPDPHDGPEEALRNSQMARRIEAVLSPRELECLRLRADGLSYDEAAEVLGVRPGTVSSLLTRVHKKLHDGVRDAQSATLGALYLLVAGRRDHSS